MTILSLGGMELSLSAQLDVDAYTFVPLPEGPTWRSLNDLGVAVGEDETDRMNRKLVLYSGRPVYGLNAGLHTLALPSAPATILRVYKITNSGYAVGTWAAGTSRTSSFFWDQGEVYDLGFEIQVIDVNERGWMAGTIPFNPDFGSQDTPATRREGPFVALGLTPFGLIERNESGTRGIFVQTRKINNEGTVLMDVNLSFRASRDDPYSQDYRVYVWNDNYTTIDEVLSTWELGNYTDAFDLNNKGQIVGTVTDPGGESGGFLYLPEPDYGLPAGRHILDQFAIQFLSDEGHVVVGSFNDTRIWKDGETYPLIDMLPVEGEVANLAIMDVSPRGNLLVRYGFFNPFRLLYAMLVLPGDGVEVEIELPEENPHPAPNEVVPVTVRVTSREEDPQTIQFEEILGERPLPAFGSLVERFIDGEEEPQPELPEPFTLTEENPSEEFIIPLRILEGGVTDLFSSLIVTSPDNQAERIETEERLVIDPPLQITVTALPLVGDPPDEVPIVNMKLQDNPATENVVDIVVTDEEDQVIEPKVQVKVVNPGRNPIKFRMQGVDPRSRDDSDVLGRIEVLGSFPSEAVELGENGEWIAEYALQINEDGRYEFEALVTAWYPQAIEDTLPASGKGAPIAVNERYPVEIEFDFARGPEITGQNNGAFFLEPGEDLRVIATVRNLTTNKTLVFKGIRTETGYNALSGILTASEEETIPPMPPALIDNEVDADGFVVIGGKILTMADGAPSGTCTWVLPEGKNALLIDDATGEEEQLTKDDILVKTEVGGWRNDPLTVKVIQDYRRPIPEPLTFLQRTAFFSYGMMISIGQWTHSTYDGIGTVGVTILMPERIAAAFGRAWASMAASVELMAFTWKNMKPEEKEELVLNIAYEVFRRGILTTTTGRPWEEGELQEAIVYTQNLVYPFFNSVEQAYASDDQARIAELLGSITGNVAIEVATGFVPGPEFVRFANAAELTTKASNLNKARLITSQDQFLREVSSGAIDLETAVKGWAVAPDEITRTRQFLDRLGMKGYLRERSKESIRLIDELDEAVWKPELMKPKSFSEVDRLLLNNNIPTVPGKPPGNQPLPLDGMAVIFLPEPDAVIRSRLSGQYSEEVIEAVLERAADRRSEYHDYLAEFREWEDTGLPVKFNYADNRAVPPDSSGAFDSVRGFETVEVSHPNAPQIIVPKMTDVRGNLRYIAGDIDWVHFSWMDGTPLSSEAAGVLYTVLSRCCGLQHGEAVSWIRDGQTLFKAKANQLTDYISGQKALLEVSGDGYRSVRIKESMTYFASDGRSHLIWFENGTKTLRRALRQAELYTAFADLQRLFPRRSFVVPFLWIPRAANEVDGTIGGRDWSYSESDSSQLLRQNESGVTERFNGTEWVPFDTSQGSGELEIVPATTLAAVANRGTGNLRLTNLPELWQEELEGRLNDWIGAGDRIVIAPGEPTQEVRTLTQGSGGRQQLEALLRNDGTVALSLDRPLIHDHPVGTTIAVLPDHLLDQVSGPWDSDGDQISDAEERRALTDPFNPLSYFTIEASRLVNNGNGLWIQWNAENGRSYTLERRSRLESGNWQPVRNLGSSGQTGPRETTETLPQGQATHWYRIQQQLDP